MYAIYARQSVEKKESISIEMQIDLCKMCLPEHEKTGIYEDRGYSGTNTNRPAFRKMLAEVKEGNIKGIIVYKLDRISRSLSDFARLTELLEKQKVKLISYTEHLNTESPTGRMLIQLLIMFAEMEQKTISGRIRDNYMARAEKMLPLGGRVPYGYNSDWSENTRESQEIRKIFSEILSGKSLDAAGRSTYKKRFTGTQAGRIIRNPVYVRANEEVIRFLLISGKKMLGRETDYKTGCGIHMIRSCGNLYFAPGDHDGIIDPEIWITAQELLKSRSPSSNSGSGKTSWIAGLMQCEKCGSSCYIRSNGRGRPYLYIVCRGRREGICDGFKGLRLEPVESFTEKIICRELEKMDAETGSDKVKSEDNPAETEVKLENLLKIAMENDSISDDLTDEIFTLERKMQIMSRKEKSKRSLFNNDKPALWKELEFDEKKAAARVLIKKIIIRDEKTTVILK
ncbi:MAG: recombinase family protein [Ruminococcus sp.]